MAKYIEAAALRGANKLVTEAELLLKRVTAEKGGRTPIAFPDTSYYLPVILGITGKAVEKSSDLEPILQRGRKMLGSTAKKSTQRANQVVRRDPGMAALFAAETIEAMRRADEWQANPFTAAKSVDGARHEDESDVRHGVVIDDMRLRQWGIQLLSGHMPGVALIMGCAKSNSMAVKIVQELRRRNILCFLSGNVHGRSIIDQLHDAGMELGIDTAVVPFGIDTISSIHALGFAARLTMMFGGLKPGKSREILSYSKHRILGFVLALGELDDLKHAMAAGAVRFGFPLVTDSVVRGVKPGSGSADGNVVPMPFETLNGRDDAEKAERLVQKCVEVRGMKVNLPKIDVPVQYGSAFDGESVRDTDMCIEFGGAHSQCFEFLQIAEPDEVIDGKIEINGPEFSKVEPQAAMDLGILVKVAGRQMQADFEPFLERQINHFINCAQGVQVTGQRDRARIRISSAAAESGFNLESIGRILQARFREDFGTVVDKVQVAIITDPKLHAEWLAKARRSYQERDQRLAKLTDERVDAFYSCTTCQSFAPHHVCMISPERPGLCGAYDWLGCAASYSINPGGRVQPIKLGRQIDAKRGLWEGTNAAVKILSHGAADEVSMYSIMEKPMTACCSSECVVMLIPEANGVMVVSREDASKTPAGVTFSTLACIAGGSPQTTGMMGVARSYLTSPKFIAADGGFKRVVWMSSVLKETMSDELAATCGRVGDPDLLNKIADEQNVTSVEDLLAWMRAHNHPAMELEPMF